MTNYRVNSNETFTIDVAVRESDKYTESAYLRFEKHDIPEEIRGCHEMFLTVDELANLGKFLQEQSQIIKDLQLSRKKL